ncbi:MAG: RNA-binding S4 domain-containing protein [Actinobacteria bacterium]|nr:RNA-binding S4 domain-containing protein [Actinomycetota bacterium]
MALPARRRRQPRRDRPRRRAGQGAAVPVGAVTDVSIGGESIRLGQFLKFAGLLDSGGDAKEAIIDGYVRVNGEVERRRGRQLTDGDLVGYEERTVRVRP